MLCYFGNFGGSNPPPPTSDVEITRTSIGGVECEKKYISADTRAVYNGLTRLSFCTEKSTIDYFVDKWATWLMLCYFGNFGRFEPSSANAAHFKTSFSTPKEGDARNAR